VLATQGKGGASSRLIRPLGDKTPAPNRSNVFQGGYDGLGKMPKLILVEVDAPKDAATPEMQRPSSTRKHSRSRRSIGQKFETPVNDGRHWDVGNVNLGSPELEVQEAIPEVDLDEVEYMAPNTLGM